MIKPKIGIRYCGGCNPHYERVEMIQRVQSAVEDRFLFVGDERRGLDGLIAVSGCLRGCAMRDVNPQEAPCHSIAEISELGNLMNWLSTFGQKKTERLSRGGR